MIATGDPLARHAFRIGLREEPPPNVTQELDANDILEVEDVARAIARAEEFGRVGDRLDVFDALVRRPAARATRLTDDTSGPALHLRAATPTPLPPLLLPTPPAPPPAPDDDAFFHPAGRIRTFGEVTLDGYRPEPTLLVRLRKRRGKLSWLVGAIVIPFGVLAGAGLWLGPSPALSKSPAQRLQHAPLHVTARAHTAVGLSSDAPTFDVKSLPAARR